MNQFYGYRCNKSLLELFNHLKSNIPIFNKVLNNYLKQQFVCNLYYKFDLIATKQIEEKFDIDNITHFFQDAYLNNKKSFNLYNGVLLCLFSYDENTTFIQNFSDNIFQNMIDNKLGFEDYSWIENKKPENLTSKEWQKRFEAWNKIINDSHIENNCLQFHINIWEQNLNWTYEELKELFINFTPNIRLNGYLEIDEYLAKSNSDYKSFWKNIIPENLAIITKEIYESKTII